MAPESAEQLAEDEDRIELAWYASALQRHWKLALAGAILGAALGFTYATLQPVVYEGVTSLLVVTRTLPSGVQINPPTFSSIVKNVTLASQVIADLKLQDRFTPQAFIERAVDIEELPGTSIVKLKVRMADPKTAAEASRRLAEAAVAFTQKLSEQQGASTSDQLADQLKQATDRRQKAEQDLLAYQQRAKVERLRQDTETLLKKRGALAQTLIDLKVERARLAAAEQEMKRQPPRPSAGRSTPTDGAPDTAQIGTSAYVALDAQIATTRTRIAALEAQRDALTNMNQGAGDGSAELGELYQRELEAARLSVDLDLARRLYNDAALRYQQSRTESVANTPRVQVLDNAQPPDRPMSRKRMQYVLAGLAAGVLGGMLIGLLLQTRGRAGGR